MGLIGLDPDKDEKDGAAHRAWCLMMATLPTLRAHLGKNMRAVAYVDRVDLWAHKAWEAAFMGRDDGWKFSWEITEEHIATAIRHHAALTRFATEWPALLAAEPGKEALILSDQTIVVDPNRCPHCDPLREVISVARIRLDPRVLRLYGYEVP